MSYVLLYVLCLPPPLPLVECRPCLTSPSVKYALGRLEVAIRFLVVGLRRALNFFLKPPAPWRKKRREQRGELLFNLMFNA